ncbi:hypothetical protein [Pseudoalteromonas sp.]|uniref:hypothetical protein n=1 Tax=Pseudoalteromonas sp. TaxID=53249 RepID=UPI003D119F73
MNKYPYIGESRNNGTIVLFSSESYGAQLWRESANYQDGWNESLFKNITAEYLTNTYGKVENKEHAEFIKLLAGNEGINCNYMVVSDEIKYFYFSGGVLFFTFSSVYDERFKLITIPLPPKEKPMESQKEWPQVGDYVICKSKADNIRKGELLALTKEYAIVKYDGFEHSLHLGAWELEKSTSTEEELSKSILKFLESGKTYDRLAKAIINGEIEGLEYKPQ